MKRFRNPLAILTAFLIVMIANETAICQSQWLDPGRGNSISMEIYKPIAPQDSVVGSLFPTFSGGSGALFLTGRYNVSNEFTLVCELAMANGKLDYEDKTQESPDESGFKFGNPYIGAEYHLPNSPLTFELGLRIPVTPKDPTTATLVGARADINRFEAFVKDIVPVVVAVDYNTVSESDILLKARAGGSFWFNTDTDAGFDSDPEVSVDYTLQTGYISKYVHAVIGLTGRYDVSSGPKYPEKYNYIQYGLVLTFPYKSIRPGLSFKVPGSDAEDLFNYVIGLNFTYDFK